MLKSQFISFLFFFSYFLIYVYNIYIKHKHSLHAKVFLEHYGLTNNTAEASCRLYPFEWNIRWRFCIRDKPLKATWMHKQQVLQSKSLENEKRSLKLHLLAKKQNEKCEYAVFHIFLTFFVYFYKWWQILYVQIHQM